ncbi:MAG TPA: zinc ribbon domain-containing protein YjdM [Bradyrhizobium sp.]|nr:zinc ribbon domain-containing protein YjdM [Bradyrhizobium sp.]
MDDAMNCPKCNSEHAYEDGSLWVCPECAHEWSAAAGAAAEAAPEAGVRDANGNPLADGDAVIVIKDLKVKGSSSVVKGGTKVRNIRLSDGADGHNIACKIDGIGAMNLKSEFVKKA